MALGERGLALGDGVGQGRDQCLLVGAQPRGGLLLDGGALGGGPLGLLLCAPATLGPAGGVPLRGSSRASALGERLQGGLGDAVAEDGAGAEAGPGAGAQVGGRYGGRRSAREVSEHDGLRRRTRHRRPSSA